MIMDNKKKTIGFQLPGEELADEIQEREERKSELKLQLQISMVLAHFQPAENAAVSEELLSTFDVQEKLSLLDLEPSDIYHLLKQAGFNHISIEGDLYWPVVYP
jgi:hypothetical protein